MSAPSERLARAIAAIDAANAADPHTLVVRGEERAKEQAHAELASEWIAKLVEEPSEALQLAARAHHVQRWVIPRAEYPMGKPGYYGWRKALQAHHAEVIAIVLREQGYDDATSQRVQDLVRKKKLGSDPEMQALEDALCLVFLETQLLETARKLDDEAKAIDVLRKTARKMSPRALELAADLPPTDGERELLARALADD